MAIFVLGTHEQLAKEVGKALLSWCPHGETEAQGSGVTCQGPAVSKELRHLSPKVIAG